MNWKIIKLVLIILFIFIIGRAVIQFINSTVQNNSLLNWAFSGGFSQSLVKIAVLGAIVLIAVKEFDIK